MKQSERRDLTCQRLYRATVECLAGSGYAATTTTEICRRAGLSAGALFNLYPAKEDLSEWSRAATLDDGSGRTITALEIARMAVDAAVSHLRAAGEVLAAAVRDRSPGES